MTESKYRGRFAPSPTGPLHFGSLVAAVASFTDARSQGGAWLVRIEDVDEQRRKNGAEGQILNALQGFGMHWDGQVLRQSTRRQAYARALEILIARGIAFRCNCSRNKVSFSGHMGPEGPIYPGTCRITPPALGTPAAWRVKVDDCSLHIADRVCGVITQKLAQDIGDFVIKRVDGYTAYQLAVVVDDHDQRISHVVRGADLLWSTPRQVWLQQQLGFATPEYAHVPLVYDDAGHKLSKSSAAHPVDEQNPLPALLSAWSHLGQIPPTSTFQTVGEFWQWALPRWHIEHIPKDRICSNG